MTVDRTDAELLRDYRSGDLRAFEELYDRHARLVLTCALSLLGNHADAEEVLQDVFTAFARQAVGLPPPRRGQ